jgi:hypothetical protein
VPLVNKAAKAPQHNHKAVPRRFRIPAALLRALPTDQATVLHVPMCFTDFGNEPIRPSRSPFAVHTLICTVVSRALLRLTANSSLAAPGSTAVFCFRFAALKGFGSPAILRTGAPAPLHALAVPPKKQTLALGAAPLALGAPKDIGAEKGEPSDVCQSRHSHWFVPKILTPGPARARGERCNPASREPSDGDERIFACCPRTRFLQQLFGMVFLCEGSHRLM